MDGSWRQVKRSALKEIKKRKTVTIRFKTATTAQFEKIPQRKLWAIIDQTFHEAVATYGRMYGVRVKIDSYFPKKTASKDVLIEFAKHMQRYMPDDAPMVFTL
jgi:hypothetical protein